jgi:nucleotide-binding universal stress UspA family protein
MHVLVAVDGSNESHEALERAIEVTEPADGSITVVHAVNPDVYEFGGMEPISGLADADERLLIESLEDAEARGDEILADAVSAVQESDVGVDSELLYGSPADRIVEYADQHDVDGIYVGHRGMSERLESILGSVAKRITERATVPVTIVR